MSSINAQAVGAAAPAAGEPRVRRRPLPGWLSRRADRDTVEVLLSVLAWSAALELVVLLGARFGVAPHPGQAPLTVAWLQWDGVWFHRVVAYGYWAHLVPPDTPRVILRAAFYPGYPLVARGFYEVLRPFGLGITASMLVANQVLLFPLAVLLQRFGAAVTGSRRVGVRSVQALLVFPFAYFLLAPFSETLFVLCVAGFSWALVTRRYAVAAAFAALAGLTRPHGAVLCAVLLVGYLEHHGWRPRALLRLQPLACIAASLSGTAAYVIYQKLTFGSARYAEMMEKAGWYRSFTLNIPHVIAKALGGQPLTAGPFADVTIEAVTMLGLLAVFIALSVVVWRRQGPALGLMCVLLILVSLSSGTMSSFNRFVLPILPCFVVLGEFMRSRLFDFAYRTAGVILLALFLLLYTHSIWTG